MLLGLSGIFVPALIIGMPPWQSLVQMVGTVILIPSLLARHEYRDASLPPRERKNRLREYRPEARGNRGTRTLTR